MALGPYVTNELDFHVWLHQTVDNDDECGAPDDQITPARGIRPAEDKEELLF